MPVKEDTPKKKVTDRFNYLLGQKKFYDSNIFPEKILTSFVFQAVKEANSEFDLILSNRLLIEYVFPLNIIKPLSPFREKIRFDGLDNPDDIMPHPNYDHLEATYRGIYAFVDDEIKNEADPIKKEIIRLKFHKNKTIEEIYEKFNVPKHVVRNVINEVKIRMKKRLENVRIL